MRIIKEARDYVRWMFFPSSFIFPKDQEPQKIAIRGWEVLELVSNQKALKEINRATGKQYLAGQGNKFLSALFGHSSVFTLDGSLHKTARKIIGRELSREKVQLTEPHIKKCVQLEFEKLEKGKNVNVGLLSRRITMRSILPSIVGDDSDELFEDFFFAFERCTGFLANLVSYNKLFWTNEETKWYSIRSMVNRRVTQIDKTIYSLITNRRASQKLNNDCVLDRLIEAQASHGYDDKFIRDNIVSTIAAGYDTSGSALTWMFFWLSKPREHRELLRKAQLDKADSYINSFIHESLRYCPPLEILPRKFRVESSDDEQSQSKGEVTMVCPCPHLVHHDASIYKKPDEFIADRFVDQKFSVTEYFPYGATSRMCLGSGLAHLILKSTLKHALDKNQVFQFKKTRFSPIRRNVSIWPGFFNTGLLLERDKD